MILSDIAKIQIKPIRIRATIKILAGAKFPHPYWYARFEVQQKPSSSVIDPFQFVIAGKRVTADVVGVRRIDESMRATFSFTGNLSNPAKLVE
jgi:hypothetical protein